MTSRRAHLGAVVAVLALAGSTFAALPALAAAPAPTPVVVGNHLVDSRTGAVWVPHGANVPSFEYACVDGYAYSNTDITDDASATALASWGVNVVRVPLNEDCWLGINSQPNSDQGADPKLTVGGYRSAVEAWVATLNSHGIVAILDLHWSAPGNYVPIDGQRSMADADHSTAFWSAVATQFASNPSVMFDLFNEPYSRGANALTWSCWKNGGCRVPVESDESQNLSGTTYTAVGMASLVSTVRAAGASQPLLLGGLNYANDLSGWLANKPDDDQLVASYHGYEGEDCARADCWNSTLASVAAQVPLIAGEFGSTNGSTAAAYLTNFMTWADAHGVGYLPWAWVVSDDPGDKSLDLLSSTTTYAPSTPTGTTYLAHLQALAAAAAPSPSPSPSTTPSATPVARVVAPVDTKPFGAISAKAKRHGKIVVSGWAIDREAAKGVRVTVRIGSGARHATTANRSTPRPPKKWKSLGTHHGYTLTIAHVKPGKHRVCAWATNVGGTAAKVSLGCVVVRN